MTDAERLLADHVERFNAGFRSGDWSPMVAGFAEDATMEFEGVPAGPFDGRDAIAAAYRDQPPDDEIVLLAAPQEADGVVTAPYAWARSAGTVAGELRLTPAGERIQRLVVTFA